MEVMGLNPIDTKILENINHYWPMRGFHVATSHWLSNVTCEMMIEPLVILEVQLSNSNFQLIYLINWSICMAPWGVAMSPLCSCHVSLYGNDTFPLTSLTFDFSLGWLELWLPITFAYKLHLMHHLHRWKDNNEIYAMMSFLGKF